MTDPVIAALFAAWRTTLIATTLFTAALGMSMVWNGPLYIRALHDALAQNPLG